jgi:tetratricopeptide (TPR) repeat protein
VALARVLLQRRGAPAAPAPVEIGQLTPPARQEQPVARKANLLALIVVLTTGLQPALDEQPMPDVDEALKLADAAIKAGNNEGYLIRAQALARKGQWSLALQEYTKGLDLLTRGGQARMKPEYIRGLNFLIQNHPAFKRPDSLNPPDPILGEKRFGEGLRYYNSHLYPQAEREFFEAVRYNDQDARYWYYLGLARLLQGKQAEAGEDFRSGSLLERQNKPTPAAVSFSLERVQGPLRQTLNAYRP